MYLNEQSCKQINIIIYYARNSINYNKNKCICFDIN